MGNRAVITTKAKRIGIYLHWNGGRDSVEAFLKYCELQNFRSPDYDDYGWARLAQIISNFLGGGLSIGIDEYNKLDTDNGDNGVYIIEDWKIVGREYTKYPEQQEYKLNEMLKAIDEKQPTHMQLGEFLNTEEVNTEDIKIGDEVFIHDYDGYQKYTVVGFGDGKYVNGINAKDVPYVNKYLNDGVYTGNPNNYITTSKVRRVKKEN